MHRAAVERNIDILIRRGVPNGMCKNCFLYHGGKCLSPAWPDLKTRFEACERAGGSKSTKKRRSQNPRGRL